MLSIVKSRVTFYFKNELVKRKYRIFLVQCFSYEHNLKKEKTIDIYLEMFIEYVNLFNSFNPIYSIRRISDR